MSNLEVHHTKFRSHARDDSDANLITLCTTCHALVHRKMLAITRLTKQKATIVSRSIRLQDSVMQLQKHSPCKNIHP
jgi:predicted HNH restriction endonuclease